MFGEIEAALYGIISIVCTTQAVDTLLYGMNKGSLITIHSEKNEEIAREIMETMDRGTTFYKSIGGYSGKEGAAGRTKRHLKTDRLKREKDHILGEEHITALSFAVTGEIADAVCYGQGKAGAES